MLRVLFGIAIPVFGTVFGVTYGGGRIYYMLHVSELITILGFIIGGLIMAFGCSASLQMFWSVVSNKGGTPDRFRKNIRICEAAAKFSLYGGFVSCFAGIVITLGAISGDVAMVAEHFGAALSGLIVGAGIAGVVFQPLKFRFLEQLDELESAQVGMTRTSHEKTVS